MPWEGAYVGRRVMPDGVFGAFAQQLAAVSSEVALQLAGVLSRGYVDRELLDVSAADRRLAAFIAVVQ